MLIIVFLIVLAIASFLLLQFLYKRYRHTQKLLHELTEAGRVNKATLNLFSQDAFAIDSKKSSAPVSVGSSVTEAETLSLEIEDIQWVLNKKKQELQQIKQERKLATETAALVEHIDTTIYVLEDRLVNLEKEISEFKSAALAKEEQRFTIHHLKEEQAQNIQLLHTTLSENETLRLEWESMKEELRETKFQKQQLQKKVKLLEELNKEFMLLSKTS